MVTVTVAAMDQSWMWQISSITYIERTTSFLFAISQKRQKRKDGIAMEDVSLPTYHTFGMHTEVHDSPKRIHKHKYSLNYSSSALYSLCIGMTEQVSLQLLLVETWSEEKMSRICSNST